jgi:hypothetical protein
MILKRTEKDGVVTALYESSNILASKWDGKDLTVIFKRGAAYTYNDVSNTDYVRFETADSQGVVLNSNIKSYNVVKQDDINPDVIINEIDTAKLDDIRKFEEGMIVYMKSMTSHYDDNKTITKVSLERLTEMIIKHSELAGETASVKLCACN